MDTEAVTPAASDQLFVIGASHHTAPLEMRERIALDASGESRLGAALGRETGIAEMLILSTCNRTEVYGVGDPAECSKVMRAFFGREMTVSAGEWGTAFSEHRGEAAVRHLFEVCAGLDSQIVGETEILGQVKAAYRGASDRKSAGPVLHRLFQKGFQAAKWVRSHTGVGSGHVSIGNVAVDLAVRIFGDLRRSRVLVVGTGEVGRGVSKALYSRGARRITVTGRRPEPAALLASEVGAESLPFTDWIAQLPRFDIVICSTGASEPVLSRAVVASAMQQRPGSPMFVIDVAVPRDAEVAIDGLNDVFLYNMDDLAAIANENLEQRHAEIARCREHLTDRARRLAPQLLRQRMAASLSRDHDEGREITGLGREQSI